MDGERKVSLGQAGSGADHAERVVREKIGAGPVGGGAGGPSGAVVEMAMGDQAGVVEKVIGALKTVFDPEIPLNIYDLGLVYRIAVDATNGVRIEMTLTSPGCPVAGSIVAEVRRKVEGIGEVPGAAVELVWDPPWTKERLSEEALLELGLL